MPRVKINFIVSAFVLLNLCLRFCISANKTVILSVIPLTAVEKDVPVYAIGTIVTTVYVSGLLTNLILLRFAERINIEKSFIFAAPITSLAMIVLGFSYYINDTLIFEMFCILDRLICGITNSIEYSCVVPLVTSIIPQKSALFITLLQIFDGVGSMSGPVIGSMFARIFRIPTLSFIILGIVQFLISLLIFLLLSVIMKTKQAKDVEIVDEENSLGLLVKKTRIIPFIIFSSFLFYFMVITGFLETSITIVYKEELDIGYDFNWIFFTFRDISYIASSFFISFLTKMKVNNFIFASSLITFTAGNIILVAINFFDWQTATGYILANILQALGYAGQNVSGLFILEQCVNLESLSPKFVRFAVYTWVMVTKQGGRLVGTQIIGGFLFTYFSFYQLITAITLCINIPLIIANFSTLGFGNFCVRYDVNQFKRTQSEELPIQDDKTENE